MLMSGAAGLLEFLPTAGVGTQAIPRYQHALVVSGKSSVSIIQIV
jgi:hypothetical protein